MYFSSTEFSYENILNSATCEEILKSQCFRKQENHKFWKIFGNVLAEASFSTMFRIDNFFLNTNFLCAFVKNFEKYFERRFFN